MACDNKNVSGIATDVGVRSFNELAQKTFSGANDHKKAVFFVGDNGTGHAVLNKIIPQCVQAGIEPVVYLTGETKSSKTDLQSINDFSFYETGILKDIYRFLESEEPIMDDKGRLRPDVNYSLSQLQEYYGIEINHIDSVNEPDLVSDIVNDPGVIGAVSMKNYHIFDEATIDSFQKADKFLWNVHSGELPGYRGVFIPMRVMLDENPEYGWTLHEIDNDIDTGPVIDIRTMHYEDDSSVLDLYYGMVGKGADMILDNVKLAAKNMPRPPISQDQSQARYFSFPKQENFDQLHNKGLVMYSEKDAINMYVNMFSDNASSSEHSSQLKNVVEQAIENNFKGKDASQDSYLCLIPNPS